MLSRDVQHVGIEVDELDHVTKSFNARQKRRAKNIADASYFLSKSWMRHAKGEGEGVRRARATQ